MRHGDFASAWAVNDAVLAARDPAGRDDPTLPYHLRWVWDGRCFNGRDVLVRCYHGLGDTLQFARYLPAPRARAASVTLEVQPALLALLRQIPGVDRLIAFDPAHPARAAACDIEIMELAHGDAGMRYLGKDFGIGGIGENRLGHIASHFAGVDVEGGANLDIANVLAAKFDLHQSGHRLIGRGVAVGGDALHQRRRQLCAMVTRAYSPPPSSAPPSSQPSCSSPDTMEILPSRSATA